MPAPAPHTPGSLRLRWNASEREFLAELDGVVIGHCGERDLVQLDRGPPLVRVQGRPVEYRQLEIAEFWGAS